MISFFLLQDEEAHVERCTQPKPVLLGQRNRPGQGTTMKRSYTHVLHVDAEEVMMGGS